MSLWEAALGWVSAAADIAVVIVGVMALSQYRAVADHNGKLAARATLLSEIELNLQDLDKVLWTPSEVRPDLDSVTKFVYRGWTKASLSLLSPDLVLQLQAAQEFAKSCVRPLSVQHEYHDEPLTADSMSRLRMWTIWIGMKSDLDATLESERLRRLLRHPRGSAKTCSSRRVDELPPAARKGVPDTLEEVMAEYEEKTSSAFKNNATWVYPLALEVENKLLPLILASGERMSTYIDRLALAYREVYGRDSAVRILPSQVPGSITATNGADQVRERMKVIARGPRIDRYRAI